MRIRWLAVSGTALLLGGPMGWVEVRAEPERVAAARRVLEAAPQAGPGDPGDLRVVLVADGKDHGPPGNGLHDYPLWQKRWLALLGDRATAARGWPSERQFAEAGVMVAYCYLRWDGKRLAQMRRYLGRGGDLVLVHSATWTKPEPSEAVAALTGVGGFRLYRHGRVRVDIAAPKHPVCTHELGSLVLDNDESYWPPVHLREGVTVLATSVEEQGAKGRTPKGAQPMFWCHKLGKGRVFGCVPGHRAETFEDPFFRILLLRGIAWAHGGSPYRLDDLVLDKNDEK